MKSDSIVVPMLFLWLYKRNTESRHKKVMEQRKLKIKAAHQRKLVETIAIKKRNQLAKLKKKYMNLQKLVSKKEDEIAKLKSSRASTTTHIVDQDELNSIYDAEISSRSNNELVDSRFNGIENDVSMESNRYEPSESSGGTSNNNAMCW